VTATLTLRACKIADVMDGTPSYVAFRALPGPRTGAWWSAVRRSTDAPLPLAALVNGRTRVEVSIPEARVILAWAATMDGWADADPKPILVHPARADA
jgi:hypothetical protein